jgi:protein SCO1/2
MQAGDTAAGADPPAAANADANPGVDEESATGRSQWRLLLPVVVLLVIIGGVTLLLVGGSSKQALPGNAGTAKAASFAGLALSPPEPAPPLSTLRNYDGTSFNLGGDRGKAVFVTFLYSHCPDVCPLIAAQLHNTYARMTPAMRRQVGIVVVSVDPRGDSAGAVAAFMRSHQLAGEGRYLIGSAGQLVPVWKAWNVGSEADTSRPDLVNHSALIYGISAKGRIYTVYSANFQPAQIIHDVPPLLAR